MPRRRRHWANHACYHVTHRCHERQFLFKFAKYRDMYRQWYEGSLAELLARKVFMRRQAFWTESLAVGGADWVESAAAQSGMKRYNVIEADSQWPENVTTVFLRSQYLSKAM